jgi:hypothetical protein
MAFPYEKYGNFDKSSFCAGILKLITYNDYSILLNYCDKGLYINNV